MNTQKFSSVVKPTIFLILLIFSASTVFGAVPKNNINSYKGLNGLVVNRLRIVLQKDLFEKNLDVRLRTIKEKPVTANVLQMTGNAFYVFTKNNIRVPIRYSAKIDIRDQRVSEITYDFVETGKRSPFAPTALEDTLTDLLLKKINVDYKTEDIVIALDEKGSRASGSKNGKTFAGSGEIRINNQTWKKIDFTIELNLTEKTTPKVVYKIK